MKKSIFVVLVLGVLMILPFAALSFAEDMPPGMMGDESQQVGDQKSDMKHKHRMQMMAMMNKPSVTATSDGGVVVLAGPKLVKYDKDLNWVKEVEIKRPEHGKDHDHGAADAPSASETAAPAQ